MASYCLGSPTPTFDGIYAGIMANAESSISSTFAGLPSLRAQIFSTVSHPALELHQIAQELQSHQLLTTMMALFKPVVSFLGISLDSILPKIPGTNLTLIDLLSITPEKLYSTIEDVVTKGGSIIAGLIPSTMYMAVDIPAIRTVAVAKLLIKDHLNVLTGVLTGLIKQVTDKLSVAGMTIPTFPTLETIEGLVLNKATSLVTGLETSLLNKLTAIETQLAQKIKTLVLGEITKIIDVESSVIVTAQNAVLGIENKIASIGKKELAAIQGIVNEITNEISLIENKIVGTITGFEHKLVNTIVTSIYNVEAKIYNLIGKYNLSSFLINAINNVTSKITSIEAKALSYIQGLFGSIDAIKNLVLSKAASIQNAINLKLQFIAGKITSLENIGLSVLNTIKDDITKVENIFSNLKNAASKFGAINSGISISKAFSGLTLPGIGALLPSLPDPLIQGFSCAEIEYHETLNILLGDIHSIIIGKIVNFALNTLSSLGFSFPTICVSF